MAPALEGAAPPTLEAYYQETGRAGRNSQLALGVLLWRQGNAAPHPLFKGVEGFACT